MALKPVTVSQLNGYIKRILQTDPLLGTVSVIGEISNLKFHGSGHIYFSMKDAGSRLNCFLPADRVRELRYQLSEGMVITASGYIYLYERGGSYSLNIKDIQVSGLGNLSIAFEQLKAKLEKEGLFDPKYKKELPFFPEKIAVITSESGAAIRDILKIIKKRNNYVDVLIVPVLVQGPAAAAQIADAVRMVNAQFPEVDTIIVGRGGGAMEELWAFNEEPVARSIFESEIPVISAVGHETDITISDFAADLRAETPTAAAHMAVPDLGELRAYIEDLKNRAEQALDTCLRYKQMQLDRLDLSVFRRDLESRIMMEQMRIENLKTENLHRMTSMLQDLETKIHFYKAELESLDPKKIMGRGYGAITGENGNLIGSIEQMHPKDIFTVVLKDGQAVCTVDQIRRKSV